MIQKFNSYIQNEKLFVPENKILLTVSGGIDSMVMADLFLKSSLHFGICHCNFSLRGDESDKDEEFVKQWALQHKIPFHNVTFNTTGYAAEKRISIQVAARELRYEWFEKTRKDYGYDFIATAHQMNDNIETILINLTRGTGLSGLSGIKSKNGYIIRPLLFATREEITNYAKTENIYFREDSSNAKTKYTRNKIRHLVIPVLKQINPSLEYSMTGTAAIIDRLNHVLNTYTQDISKTLTYKSGDKTMVKICELRKYIDNKPLLYELFREYNVTEPLIDNIIDITEGSNGKQVITSTHRIVKDRENLIICPLGSNAGISLTINNIQELNLSGFLSAETVPVTDKFVISKERDTACIDYSKITFPLTVRTWKHGDSFIPLGMENRKKISDYLINRKISIIDKDRIRVIESDDKIIWVIGERIDDRYKITPDTKEALIIKVSDK